MITLLLACATHPSSDTSVTESVQISVVDLGDCPIEGTLSMPEPDGELIGLQARIDYVDGRTFYRSDEMVNTRDGRINVSCSEGQPVSVTLWVIPL